MGHSNSKEKEKAAHRDRTLKRNDNTDASAVTHQPHSSPHQRPSGSLGEPLDKPSSSPSLPPLEVTTSSSSNVTAPDRKHNELFDNYVRQTGLPGTAAGATGNNSHLHTVLPGGMANSSPKVSTGHVPNSVSASSELSPASGPGGGGFNFVALYDFASRDDNQITLTKGDRVKRIGVDMKGVWSKVMKLDATAETGWVPTNYIGPDEDLGRFVWYHGAISRSEAEQALNSGINGSFLVRDSESSPGQLSVSLRCDGKVYHYRVTQTDDAKYCVTVDHKFSTLNDLVTYHSKNADGLVCPLLYAASRTNQATQQKQQPVASHEEINEVLTDDTGGKWEINRQELLMKQRLGSGQYGEVYEGFWTTHNLRVAVKTLKDNTERQESFLQEAAVMKKMRHPNLVQLLGVCTHEPPFYIVTEFMSRGNLLDFLRDSNASNIGPAILIYMGTQIAAAMAYLESKNFIHRDLAARNCLVGPKHTVKVADFGLARLMQEETYVAQAGAKFPIKWTAPEGLAYNKFSTKSDVWAFGILLWEVSTLGMSPYPGVQLTDVYHLLAKGYRMEKPDTCPNPIYKLMVKCWEWKPSDRPTFQEIRVILQEMYNALLTNGNEQAVAINREVTFIHSDTNHSSMPLTSVTANLRSPISALDSPALAAAGHHLRQSSPSALQRSRHLEPPPLPPPHSPSTEPRSLANYSGSSSGGGAHAPGSSMVMQRDVVRRSDRPKAAPAPPKRTSSYHKSPELPARRAPPPARAGSKASTNSVLSKQSSADIEAILESVDQQFDFLSDAYQTSKEIEQGLTSGAQQLEHSVAASASRNLDERRRRSEMAPLLEEANRPGAEGGGGVSGRRKMSLPPRDEREAFGTSSPTTRARSQMLHGGGGTSSRPNESRGVAAPAAAKGRSPPAAAADDSRGLVSGSSPQRSSKIPINQPASNLPVNNLPNQNTTNFQPQHHQQSQPPPPSPPARPPLIHHSSPPLDANNVHLAVGQFGTVPKNARISQYLLSLEQDNSSSSRSSRGGGGPRSQQSFSSAGGLSESSNAGHDPPSGKSNPPSRSQTKFPTSTSQQHPSAAGARNHGNRFQRPVHQNRRRPSSNSLSSSTSEGDENDSKRSHRKNYSNLEALKSALERDSSGGSQKNRKIESPLPPSHHRSNERTDDRLTCSDEEFPTAAENDAKRIIKLRETFAKDRHSARSSSRKESVQENADDTTAPPSDGPEHNVKPSSMLRSASLSENLKVILARSESKRAAATVVTPDYVDVYANGHPQQQQQHQQYRSVGGTVGDIPSPVKNSVGDKIAKFGSERSTSSGGHPLISAQLQRRLTQDSGNGTGSLRSHEGLFAPKNRDFSGAGSPSPAGGAAPWLKSKNARVTSQSVYINSNQTLADVFTNEGPAVATTSSPPYGSGIRQSSSTPLDSHGAANAAGGFGFQGAASFKKRPISVVKPQQRISVAATSAHNDIPPSSAPTFASGSQHTSASQNSVGTGAKAMPSSSAAAPPNVVAAENSIKKFFDSSSTKISASTTTASTSGGAFSSKPTPPPPVAPKPRSATAAAASFSPAAAAPSRRLSSQSPSDFTSPRGVFNQAESESAADTSSISCDIKTSKDRLVSNLTHLKSTLSQLVDDSSSRTSANFLRLSERLSFLHVLCTAYIECLPLRGKFQFKELLSLLQNLTDRVKEAGSQSPASSNKTVVDLQNVLTELSSFVS